jgi:hypothetical protein
VIDAFWSGVGEELARHWVARVLTPAFAFWTAGLALVWWHGHAAAAAKGWTVELQTSATQLAQLPVLAQGALVVGALVLVAASAVVAERLTGPLLRLLEGYWTRPRWLRKLLVGYRQWRYKRLWDRAQPLQLRQRRGGLTVAEFDELLRLRNRPRAHQTRRQELEQRAAQGLTSQETAQLGRDLQQLRSLPDRDDLRMPTRLGDALRAAEHRPSTSYGIDAVVCWSALWLLLPADTRTELSGTRAALDSAVRAWTWGALFVVWTPFNAWALAVAIGVPLLSYRFGLLPRALAFGQLVITCYDLHRMTLYDALHLPRPTSPDHERAVAGPRATSALSGALVEPGLRYRFRAPSTTG